MSTCFSPDGSHLAGLSGKGELIVLDAETLACRSRHRIARKTFYVVARFGSSGLLRGLLGFSDPVVAALAGYRLRPRVLGENSFTISFA